MSGVDTTSQLGALVVRHRNQIIEAAARHGARNVRVFGSVARGDAGEDSDVDLLVDFDAGSSLFDLLHLTDELEQILDRHVDVVSTGGLKDRDGRILAEALAL
jgi:hypothetical protein